MQTLALINIRTGLAGEVNVQGEQVKKLDVVSNEIFINSLKSCGKVSVMVSEEVESAIIVSMPGAESPAKYCVVFDPLDGSSNIDNAVSIGTIFGVYPIPKDATHTAADALQPGKNMIAAGYCVYGSFAIMVLATEMGVNGYTLDPVCVILKILICSEPWRIYSYQSQHFHQASR